MPIRKGRDKGVIYVIIATVCLIMIFVGFNIIEEITSNDSIKETDELKEEESNDKVVLSSFEFKSEEESTIIKDNIKIKSNSSKEPSGFRIDDFFLKTILSSNSYMQAAYKLDKGLASDFGIIKSSIIKFIGPISPTWYLKSQLPAIINALDIPKVDSDNNPEDDKSKDVFSDYNENIGESDDSNNVILEDIVLVEDPLEADGGIPLTEDNIIDKLKNEDNNAQEVANIAIPQGININPVNLDKSKPNVLIYHTHGTESYLPASEGNFHTTKRDYNVLTIGDIITKGLREQGQNVKHVDVYHDLPSYNSSYSKSLATAKEELKIEEDLKIIFDIHRDGVDIKKADMQRETKRFKMKINEKNVARFSIVIGPKNDNVEELKNFAKYIKYVSDKMYPGLCRDIIIKPYGRYNQYLSDYYALLEIGSNINTIEESKETAKLVSEILDVVIGGIEK